MSQPAMRGPAETPLGVSRAGTPVSILERDLARALFPDADDAADLGLARDRATVGRAMDALSAALGGLGYNSSRANCPDRKAEDEIGAILSDAGFQIGADGIYKQLVWQPIATATLEGPVDLWAKFWVAKSDTFVFRRFPDCRWDSGDSMCNRRVCWSGLPDGWHATHWMPAPDGPECPAYAHTPAE